MSLSERLSGFRDAARDVLPGKKSKNSSDPLGKSAEKKARKDPKVDPKLTNWDKIRGRDITESRSTRDIHSSQQMDRSGFQPLRTSTGPNVLAIMAGTLAGIVMYIFIGGVLFAIAGMQDMSNNTTEQTSQSSSDSSGQISIEEAEQRYGIPSYIGKTKIERGEHLKQDCRIQLAQDGQTSADGKCYGNREPIPAPQWYIDRVQSAVAADPEMADRLQQAAQAQEQAQQQAAAAAQAEAEKPGPLGYFFGEPSWWRILLAFLTGVIVWAPTRTVFLRQLQAENTMDDVRDINQHESDAFIQLPQEVANTYAAFPDVGAHADQQVASMLGHGMLQNKGINPIRVPKRADADILDEDGEVITYKGDVIRNSDGDIIWEENVPFIDTDFGHALFTASLVPEDKRLRVFFDATKTEHNPGGRVREIVGKEDTLAEHINNTWEFPWYEPQRPAGFYMVDVAPVNTMVLAMTRAGKGQTYIEPVIDMWTRELKPNNMVINDPKGELLVNNFVRMTRRGYQVVQFNLINALKTDIYNPLGMAAESAREGDFTKCAMYVENIAEVFFPVDGADDPVWPNAANNAFKRTAYGLIDYYLEAEREMRQRAVFEGWDQKVLDTRIDKMWGNVTLFNCYLFFVQLSAKKVPRPLVALENELNEGKITEAEYNVKIDDPHIKSREKFWDGNDEIDMLTLFFNATDELPTNGMRNLVSNSDKALRAMGGAEKMLASVYGIAITAMSFFTDPTISTLTSGTLSQNTDLGSLSFPRRFGVRFAQNFVAKYHLVGAQVKWDCYRDKDFTDRYEGSDFEHEDTLSREGWARAYFKGIFEEDTSYLRLQVLHSTSGNLMLEYYFKFTKSYQTNLRF